MVEVGVPLDQQRLDAQRVNAAVKIKLGLIRNQKTKERLEKALTEIQRGMTPREFGEYAKRMTQ